LTPQATKGEDRRPPPKLADRVSRSRLLLGTRFGGADWRI